MVTGYVHLGKALNWNVGCAVFRVFFVDEAHPTWPGS